MLNKETLENMWCPACGSLGRFEIGVTATAVVGDMGTDDIFNCEWDAESYCYCRCCSHRATVADFTHADVELFDTTRDLALETAVAYAKSLTGEEVWVPELEVLTTEWEALEGYSDDYVGFKVRVVSKDGDAVEWEDDKTIAIRAEVELVDSLGEEIPESMFPYKAVIRRYTVRSWKQQPIDLWTPEDSEAAMADGWDVFPRGSRGEIQSDDMAGKFTGDDEAFRHVVARASAGSPRELLALWISSIPTAEVGNTYLLGTWLAMRLDAGCPVEVKAFESGDQAYDAACQWAAERFPVSGTCKAQYEQGLYDRCLETWEGWRAACPHETTMDIEIRRVLPSWFTLGKPEGASHA